MTPPLFRPPAKKQRQAIEVDEEGQVNGQTTPSKDCDARWTKKNGLYKLGYKQHTRTDAEGYIEKLHITPANAHECKHLSPLLEGLPKGTTVYADKGYDSEENRQHLEERRLQDGIMRKAHRKHPLTEAQTKRNRYLSKTRYVVEQSFGTLHRKFRYARAAYFGLSKVSAQSHLKAMCLPFESRQQAKCACCRLKGGWMPDYQVSKGGLRGYLSRISGYLK